MRIYVLAIALFAFVASGCIPPNEAFYDVGLTSVERPAEASAKYGEKVITQTDIDGEEKYVFEDDMIKSTWFVSADRISFSLENKTSHSIKIVWDEAVYMSPTGSSMRVMHSGVKYTERNNEQPPTIVPRKGHITDVIIPVDHVTYVNSLGWMEAPFFPTTDYGDVAEFSAKVQKYPGTHFQVLLPLKIEDVTNEYIFDFEIMSAKVHGKDGKPYSTTGG